MRARASAIMPEMFQTPYETPIMAERAEAADGPSLSRVRGLAARHRLTVVAGTFAERHEGRIYNASYVLGLDGAVLGVHRKIHLFDIDLPEVHVVESSVLAAGDRPLVLTTPFGRLGVAVCYDVRFPDVFRYFQRHDVELVALPAAFSITTGSAHWHVLMRARAIDYQVFMAAASPAPTPGAAYRAYGHSLVVGPFGEILAEAGESEETLVIDLPAARLETVRRQMPLRRHQRPELLRSG